ncbi:MAG: hypothetical protein OXR66_04420 [Candidatus Woesearchaeota archaeon]|nr:hypothetical protein [Candidatus Woesearchaeota archaeon]
MKTALIVNLVVPDTTAITARKTLARMGISLENVKRSEYYSFEADSDLFENVSTCDVLVNVNKHTASKELEKQDGWTYILVKDKDPATNLQTMLNTRFNFGIHTLEKGVIWALPCTVEQAKNITEELLHNPHYQEYSIL